MFKHTFRVISFSESQSIKITWSTSVCLNQRDKDSLGRALSNLAAVNLKMILRKRVILRKLNKIYVTEKQACKFQGIICYIKYYT